MWIFLQIMCEIYFSNFLDLFNFPHIQYIVTYTRVVQMY